MKAHEKTFPVFEDYGGEDRGVNGGITNRDYVAIKAMQGLISNPLWGGAYEVAAEHAYKYADALIAESQKKN